MGRGPKSITFLLLQFPNQKKSGGRGGGGCALFDHFSATLLLTYCVHFLQSFFIFCAIFEIFVGTEVEILMKSPKPVHQNCGNKDASIQAGKQ